MNFRNFATAMMFLAAAAVHGADAWKPAAGNPVLSRGSFLNIHSPAVLAEDGQYTLFFSGYWGALEIFRAGAPTEPLSRRRNPRPSRATRKGSRAPGT